MHDYRNFHHYANWVRVHDRISNEDRGLIRDEIARFAETPLFTIVLLPDGGDVG